MTELDNEPFGNEKVYGRLRLLKPFTVGRSQSQCVG